ncbi:MAG: hypothetical protein ABI954_13415 [Pyrinomonadaceae bacterium]
MSELRQNEWKLLEESAMHLLLNPDELIDDKNLNLFLRLWQFPSFERHIAWVIYTETNKETLLIQKVTWNRPADAKRYSDPLAGLTQKFHTKPRISSKVKTIKVELFEPYINELLGISVPPFVNDNSAGVDGIRFGFEFRKFKANASFSWWNAAPPEWQMLENWLLRTKNFLNTQFVLIL